MRVSKPRETRQNPAQAGGGLLLVLAAGNALLHGLVEAQDAHLMPT